MNLSNFLEVVLTGLAISHQGSHQCKFVYSSLFRIFPGESFIVKNEVISSKYHFQFEPTEYFTLLGITFTGITVIFGLTAMNSEGLSGLYHDEGSPQLLTSSLLTNCQANGWKLGLSRLYKRSKACWPIMPSFTGTYRSNSGIEPSLLGPVWRPRDAKWRPCNGVMTPVAILSLGQTCRPAPTA